MRHSIFFRRQVAEQPHRRTRQVSWFLLDKLVSTDPPYYDNIGYADLSDYFYVWLRRSLKPFFPDLFTMLAVPKTRRSDRFALPPRQQGKGQRRSFSMA